MSEYAGKVVFVDFWASWCEPCARSFPWMSTMHARYEERGLVIIAVNVDDDRVKADEFLEAHDPEFEVIYDSQGQIASYYSLEGMPSSLVFDRQGNLRGDHVGFRDGDESVLEAAIVSLLAEDDE